MKFWIIVLSVLAISGILFIIFRQPELSINTQISNMKLTSDSFQNGQTIPDKYTCKGEGVNPQLKIAEVPIGTQSLVLILKDPDAPLNTFVHWLVWNISPDTSTITENSVPSGSVQGKNSAGSNIYFNPCPPSGQHHYVFYLYALDTTLTLPPEANSKDVELVITGHVLGATTLTGVFP